MTKARRDLPGIGSILISVGLVMALMIFGLGLFVFFGIVAERLV